MSNKLIILFVLFLSGCAVDPKVLKKPEHVQTIEFKADLESNDVLGLANVKWRKILKAGTYTSIGTDAKGTYFEGPKGCVMEHSVEIGTPNYYNGGFWIPSDPKVKPRMFRYFGSNLDPATLNKIGYQGANAANPSPTTPAGAAGGAIAGALINSMIKADIGKIELLPEIKDEAFFSGILASVKATK